MKSRHNKVGLVFCLVRTNGQNTYLAGSLKNRLRSAFHLLRVVPLFLILSYGITDAIAQTKTRVIGAANWNTKSTWIEVRTGTVAFVNGSVTVLGTGTLFLTELQTGDVLMMDGSPGTVRGTVATILTNTTLTLASGATANIGSAAYGSQTVPGSADNVQIGHPFVAGAVNVSLDIASATINSLVFFGHNYSHSLTHASTNNLNVTGLVTMNQPTANNYTIAWNINAGSATVSGNISFLGNNNFARINTIAITSGTLNASGGMSFLVSGSADNRIIDMSGGAGTLNLKGTLTANANGTLTAGTSGSIFNYADNVSAQTISFFALGAYHNLHFNNTSAGGVTLPAAITTANVTGNIRVLTGTMYNGGFAIVLNTSKVFEVANTATFKLTGTSGMVTGTTITKTFGATGTVDYNGAAQTVSAETYGFLTLSNSGVKTMPGSALITQSDFTTSGTISATAGNSITIGGNIILGSGTTFNVASYALAVAGNWTNNGTFTAGTGRVTFNGAGMNTLTGSSTTAFNVITMNKGTDYTSNIMDVQSLITMIAGGLTLTNGTFKLSSASTITPFTSDIIVPPFLIPPPAGLWCNGGTINTTTSMSWSLSGLLRVSAGTVNVGSALTNYFAPQTGSNIIVEGGNLNVADRISQFNAGWNFTMTGGTLTVPTVGNTTANRPPFNMDATAASFSMSGGTIIIERSGGSAGQNLGFLCLGLGGSGFTGGTLQIGDASTPVSQTIGVTSTNPVYNLTVNNANATAQLQTSDLSVTNDVTISSGVLAANSFDINVGGDWINNGGTFTPGSGTVVFNGAGAQLINGTVASQTFNNLTVSKSAGSLLSISGSTTTLTTNNLKLTSGDFTAPSTMNIIATATSSLTLTAGTFAAGIITNITGDWINNGGTFTPGSNSVVFNGSGAQAIKGTAASQSFYNLILNKSVGTVLSTSGSTTTLTVQDFTETTGDFTAPATFNINGNRTHTAGVYTAGTTTNITGNWTSNGGTFTPGTNTVIFNGTAPQLINGSATSQTFYNLTVAKTAGVLLSMGTSTTTLTANDFTLTTGKFTSPATLNINGNFLISAGTFTAGTTTSVLGNWTKNGGTFTSGSNTVNFIGTGTKTMGGTSPTSFYNLTINMVLSSDILQIAKTSTVNGVLNLTKGVMDLNGRSLSITSGLASAITRTSGYIMSEKTNNSAQIIWSIGSNLTSHTFPFGTASGSYIPFILNLTAGDIGNATVSTYPTAGNNTPYPSTPISVTNMYSSTGSDNSANTVNRFWQIDKDGASGTATLTFTATSGEMGAILMPTAQRYETSTNKWQAPLTGQTNTATSATVPGVTTFSPWTMSSNTALLPIQLVSFNAIYTTPFVALTWVTESEINSDYFTIERSTGENTFETVSEVNAAGNSIQTLNYQAMDKNPLPGLSYYRLKQVDFDGTSSYSDLVAIEITNVKEQISVFPNPVTNGMITIKVENHVSETLDISVLDMRGQVLFETKNKMDEGQQSSIVIDQLGILPKGFYILKISGAAEVYSKKIAIY